jgi:hypothetical protein
LLSLVRPADCANWPADHDCRKDRAVLVACALSSEPLLVQAAAVRATAPTHASRLDRDDLIGDMTRSCQGRP